LSGYDEEEQKCFMNQVDVPLESMHISLVLEGHDERDAAAPVGAADAGFGFFDSPMLRQRWPGLLPRGKPCAETVRFLFSFLFAHPAIVAHEWTPWPGAREQN
jgi:hypothetical protein